MDFFPMLATAVLFSEDGHGGFALAGTAACYRQPHILLTARHCVPDTQGQIVSLLNGDQPRRIQHIHHHPTADVALIVSDPALPPRETTQVWTGISKILHDGGDFIAYGYPAESADVRQQAVGRLFKGHVQRLFSYQPPSGGHSYFAAELSVPAPAGLSGGPVSWTASRQELFGVVTTNHDSYVLLDRLEEVERDGTVYREQISRVVSYGIAAVIVGFEEWVETTIQPYLM